MDTSALIDNHMCYVCGPKNTKGLRLKLEHEPGKRLFTELAFEEQHQGFKEIVHGGMLAMLLDDLMVNLAWREGMSVVTGEISTRLKKPVKVGQKILAQAFLGENLTKLVYARGQILDLSGEILVEAKATLVKIRAV